MKTVLRKEKDRILSFAIKAGLIFVLSPFAQELGTNSIKPPQDRHATSPQCLFCSGNGRMEGPLIWIGLEQARQYELRFQSLG